MKIKTNLDNNTITLKGLTPVQFQLLHTLVSHVRLGDDGNEVREAAFEFLVDAAAQEHKLEIFYLPEIKLHASHDTEEAYVEFADPTIELYCTECDN